ncbi:MAG: 50S ribosomal protein L10 [Candidatus Zambryskibacteria bacterium RIFCSPHIGHO2_02_FULL_43_14]|uniref:Large ribosomal subunit protein uL10 n=1 Tax=Candidatus Zambryskibacteria bacterium RIFCSPHIGHO2_02_FULL_43_14 TaxID=1802748 RepID=A0A1G2TFB2_9BACT|nr:MAG: 50S ribosomal protein L10 [Candidatus Zambryskibacteria bacterium RIFCSPHIGHO2_01_FULL_43_60]OHA95995.1 MAG: 50S ribosomal protein L10 [Candidatus Zambryskibacteria bacterium RIFCSPHIGHO2_02_FULL_43_14]OHB03119.1 MAG: 50S ribosomal protein L10 [Candidatus Zambryskibacteria bacterium RIFCSPLOWO2_01_FULL_42_41]
MAITRVKKGEVVDKLKKAFKDAKSLVFVNFRGLSVENTTAMRRTLKDEGVSYTVAKKTLAKRALEGEKFTGTKPELEGELALAWGDDLVVPAREVYAFQKKFPENLKIMGGVFESRFMTAVEMTEIAQIPTLEILRGKFVNIINSPIQRFVIGLNEISKIK